MRCYCDIYVNMAICDELSFLKHMNSNAFRNDVELFV